MKGSRISQQWVMAVMGCLALSNMLMMRTCMSMTITEMGIILSSFYWGYTITQLPGGFLAEKFGGKYTLGLSVLSTSMFTLLTPIVVQVFDSTGLITLRFLRENVFESLKLGKLV